MNYNSYSVSNKLKDFDWKFDDLVKPYFHKGGEVGCLVCHGFTGTPANMLSVAYKLSEAGHTVYAPLLSGHGTTLGDMRRCTREDWLNDCREAYKRLKDEGCTKFFLIGLSMGGVLMSLLARELPADGLILICTPFKMRKYLRRISKLFPFINYYSQPWVDPDPFAQGYAGFPLKSLHELDKLTADARKNLDKITCPTLFIQSRHDKRVDISSVIAAKEAIGYKGARLIWLEKAPHACTYGIEKDLAASSCAEFVAARI